MTKRMIQVFVFALVVSGGIAFVIYGWIARLANAAPKPQATMRVLVAAHSLPVGTLIRDVDLKLANWAPPAPPNAVLNKEDLVGRGVVATIYEGEPISESRLAPKGAGGGLAATIPPGMRAFAIRVNDISSVAGFVVPGMRVDILIAGSPPGAPTNLGTLSKTLLQNVEVLSAGQNIEKNAEGKPISVGVVNLLVTPEQAEIMNLATEMRIQLVLRNPLDTQVAKTPGTAVASLFSGQQYKGLEEHRPVVRVVKQAAPPVAQPKPPVVVEVIQGGTRAQATFRPEGNQ